MGLEQTFRKERPYRSNCVGHGQGGIMRYGAVPNQSLRYRFIGSVWGMDRAELCGMERFPTSL